MENCSFYSPTRFIMERGAHKLAGQEIKPRAASVLVVYADFPFMHTSGLLKDVRKSLSDAGLAYCELTGVQSNPVVSLVREGIHLSREKKVDFVLAVGGGSVIDTAKAIAIGTPYDGEVWDFYSGAACPEEALPVGAVMTFPSTGSEASNGSVLTNEESGEKQDIMSDIIRPVFCIMNPELTFTLPKDQTAFGVIDMFSHIAERYFTNSRGVEFISRICEGAMGAVIECGLRAYECGDNYDARANLMWAAVLGHNGLMGIGRNQEWCAHMMGMPVSGKYGSIHGGTISVLFPVWMEYVCEDEPEMFARFAEKVFGVTYDELKPVETAREGIEKLREFIRKLHLPVTLRELGVKDDSLFGEMAQNACRFGAIGNIRKLNVSDVIEIYKRAF